MKKRVYRERYYNNPEETKDNVEITQNVMNTQEPQEPMPQAKEPIKVEVANPSLLTRVFKIFKGSK